jgi:hypothetical protein
MTAKDPSGPGTRRSSRTRRSRSWGFSRRSTHGTVRRDDPLEFLSHAALLPLILAIWFLFLPVRGVPEPRKAPASATRTGGPGRGGRLALLIAWLFLFRSST